MCNRFCNKVGMGLRKTSHIFPHFCSLLLRDLETRQPVRHFHSIRQTQSTDTFQQSSQLFHPVIFERTIASHLVGSLLVILQGVGSPGGLGTQYLPENGNSLSYCTAEVGASSLIYKDCFKKCYKATGGRKKKKKRELLLNDPSMEVHSLAAGLGLIWNNSYWCHAV